MKTNMNQQPTNENELVLHKVTEEYNSSQSKELENIIKPQILNKSEQKKSTKNTRTKITSGLTQPKKKKVIENTQLALKKRTDLVKTYIFNYQGVDYLVDNKNNVFTFNIDNPTVVGIKLIDNSIKFY
jgi:hypothetical protein